MFWKDTYDCQKCHPYVLDTTSDGICQQNSSNTDDNGLACSDTCGIYL